MQSSSGLQKIEDQSEDALLEVALTALAKALKAIHFYPQEHPLRDESINSAMIQLKSLLNGRELILLWSRDSCSLAERPSIKSTSVTAKALAREMLTRKLQRLIFLPELSIKDLKLFLALFTVDATEITSRGGIEKAIVLAGISTIGANEVDLEGIRKQRELIGIDDESAFESPRGWKVERDGEDSGGTLSEPESESDGGSSTVNPAPESGEEVTLDVMLGRLKTVQEEQPYLQLVQEIIDLAEKIKKTELLAPLLHALDLLLQEYSATDRTSSQRDFTKYAIEQIADGSVTVFLLDQIEQRSVEHEELLYSLCSVIGKTLAYPMIQRLCIAETLLSRKLYAKALTKTGEAGIPALVSMLKDERWYVVRNMVTILGEVSSPESFKALQMTSMHPEAKVRKEVVKSLIRIAPQAGENTLISMLDDIDRDVVKQVIFSLGVLRSRPAVGPLLDLITAADAFLKGLEQKKMAIAAVGRIGDRQATLPLTEILLSRGWFAPRRWLDLKIASAAALGQLGDESALPLLKKLSQLDNPLGEACSDAADNLERIVK